MIRYASCYDPARKHKIYVDLNESIIDTESRDSVPDEIKRSTVVTSLNIFADCLYLPWHHLAEHPKAAGAPIKVVAQKVVQWAAKLFKQITVNVETMQHCEHEDIPPKNSGNLFAIKAQQEDLQTCTCWTQRTFTSSEVFLFAGFSC